MADRVRQRAAHGITALVLQTKHSGARCPRGREDGDEVRQQEGGWCSESEPGPRDESAVVAWGAQRGRKSMDGHVVLSRRLGRGGDVNTRGSKASRRAMRTLCGCSGRRTSSTRSAWRGPATGSTGTAFARTATRSRPTPACQSAAPVRQTAPSSHEVLTRRRHLVLRVCPSLTPAHSSISPVGHAESATPRRSDPIPVSPSGRLNRLVDGPETDLEVSTQDAPSGDGAARLDCFCGHGGRPRARPAWSRSCASCTATRTPWPSARPRCSD